MLANCLAFSKDVQICIDFSTDFGSIFNGFLIPRNFNFSVFVQARIRKITFFSASSKYRFFVDFGSQHDLKNPSKIEALRATLGQVGSKLDHVGPSWGHVGAKLVQDGQKWKSRGPRSANMGPR